MPHGEAAEEPFLPILPGEQQPAVHLGRADDFRSLPQRDVPQDPAPRVRTAVPASRPSIHPEEPPFGRQVIGHTVPHLLRHDARKRFRQTGRAYCSFMEPPLFIEVVCTCMDCRPVHPGPQALLYWRVRVAASESIFLKRTLDRPLKGSLYWRALGPSHPPLWCPTMALKIKIAWDSKGIPLGMLLPSFFV